jgi:hypothetical protein
VQIEPDDAGSEGALAKNLVQLGHKILVFNVPCSQFRVTSNGIINRRPSVIIFERT